MKAAWPARLVYRRDEARLCRPKAPKKHRAQHRAGSLVDEGRGRGCAAHFKESGKPFALLFWSRDPDYSQHNTKDSLGEYQPGINGPSGKAGTRNADTTLGELLAALKQRGWTRPPTSSSPPIMVFSLSSHASANQPIGEFGDPGDIGNGFSRHRPWPARSGCACSIRHAISPRGLHSGAKLAGGTGLLGDPATRRGG